jgi:hypothetical protein
LAFFRHGLAIAPARRPATLRGRLAGALAPADRPRAAAPVGHQHLHLAIERAAMLLDGLRLAIRRVAAACA